MAIAVARARQAPERIIYHAVLNTVEFVSPLPIPLGTGRMRQTGSGHNDRGFSPRLGGTRIYAGGC